MTTLSRRSFLAGALGAAAAAAVRPPRAWAASASRALAAPAAAPFDHVVVVMMENRSFDHFLGWLPGADGRQEGLAFANPAGTVYPTYNLAPDYQGCGYGDPDHSWQGGLVQLNGGKADGWLRTPANRRADDTFPIGFYDQTAVPVLGALARNYTTLDRYFAAILAETYPNRIYAHAATTDRDVNTLAISSLPTIWDRLAGAGLQGHYYFNDLPILALWGTKYASIMRPFSEFLADAAAGLLPQVSFIDPSFNGADVGTPSKVPPSAGDIIGSGEGDGTSADDHPHSDIRAGESFLAQVYQAVRSSPAWSRTVMVINYDEWGGFYDHVVPPKVVDTTTRPPNSGPHPDYRQLGFRVPCVVISQFAPARIVHDGPYEHTSVLKMIEWRWGLAPLAGRDANARNLAEVLDLSTPRTDHPAIPGPTFMPSVRCGPLSVAARPPTPIAQNAPGSGSAPSSNANGASVRGTRGSRAGSTPATGGPGEAVTAAGLAAVAGAAALRRAISSNDDSGLTNREG